MGNQGTRPLVYHESSLISIQIQDQDTNKNLTFTAGDVIKGKVMLDMRNEKRNGNLKVGLYSVCIEHDREGKEIKTILYDERRTIYSYGVRLEPRPRGQSFHDFEQ